MNDLQGFKDLRQVQESIINPVNPDDWFYSDKRLWKVWVNEFNFFYAFAQWEYEAVDEVVDWIEKQEGMDGLLYSDEELRELTEEELDDVSIAGNHCRGITGPVHIEKVNYIQVYLDKGETK